MKNAAEKVDHTLTVVSNLITKLKFNEYVVQYGNETARNYYTVTKIHHELRSNLSAFYNFGYTIDLTKHGDDLVITPERTEQKARYLAERGFAPLTEAQWSAIRKLHAPYTLETANPAGSNDITLIQKMASSGEDVLLFYTTLRGDYLLPEQQPGTPEAFGILLDGKPLLLRVSADFQPEALLAELAQGALPSSGSMDGKEYVSYSARSAVMPNWQMFYIAPKYSFLASMKQTLPLPRVILLGLLVCFGVALAYWIANKMYRPVRNAVRLFHGFETQEGKDEFRFINETAAKIQLANVQLTTAMKHNRLTLKEKCLRDLLYGLIPEEKLAAALRQHQLDKLKPRLTVGIIEFVHYETLIEQYAKEAILTFKSQTLLIIREHLELHMTAELFDLDHKRLAVIVQGDRMEIIKKTMLQALHSLEDDTEFGVVLALGHPAHSVAEIEHSYRSAVQVLGFRTVTDRRSVIAAGDIDLRAHNPFSYSLDLERELISSVIRGKREHAHTILSGLLADYGEPWSKETINQFAFAIQATLHRIGQQLHQPLQTLVPGRRAPGYELQQCEDTEQLRQKTLAMFDRVIDRILSEQEVLDSTLVEQMTAYIRENYTRDLSLTDVAEHFNFSPGYISTAFKQHTGENFKDYLNKYRVDQAKEILDRRKMKIGELALMVGCNNANTFIRMFRKYEGVSPGQYSKLKA
ncbi:helix-turn-helix domain-containing protein [Paenibacillus sp. IB182496]|uniref:Helix-turn-helix domain-containing protein n=2 Tax=Paenibacillus sabuli TaxID=2772509 RepID=A0A927BUV5_9BACL|nr:helix-turn-helix domain-containing protein [Paenibacillus sabuli]